MFAQKLVARQNAYRRISREALWSARRLQPRLSGKGDRWDHLVRIILERFAGETAVPDGGRQARRGGASAAPRERKVNSELEKGGTSDENENEIQAPQS